MITKRTDSNGEDFNNKRLKLLKICLKNVLVSGIYQLNDHKGNLTVIWENEPSEENKNKVLAFWEAFCECEVEHETRGIKQIYRDLYFNLSAKYPGSVKMMQDQILVDHSSNLFNYTDYEFYGKDMEDFKLSKLAKKYSQKFYCEWHDVFSQVICINF